jgi:hypothetical protein
MSASWSSRRRISRASRVVVLLGAAGRARSVDVRGVAAAVAVAVVVVDMVVVVVDIAEGDYVGMRFSAPGLAAVSRNKVDPGLVFRCR